jgi:PAS domain S-box-containing protein
MSIPLRVLIVEDSEDDAALIVRELSRGGYEPAFERVETPEAMSAALEAQTWDVVISDYKMPHFSGVAALQLLQEKGIDLPFILVSGTIGEDVAVETLKAGAHDFILKGNWGRLVPAIIRELRDAEARGQRKQAEEQLKRSNFENVQLLQKMHESRNAVLNMLEDLEMSTRQLRESEERYRLLSESSLTGVYLIQDQMFRYVNPVLASIFGYEVDEIIGKLGPLDLTFLEDHPLVLENLRKRIIGEVPHIQYAFRGLQKGGSVIHVEVYGARIDYRGKPAIIGTLLDITERRRAEEQLLISQTTYEGIINSITETIYIQDENGVFLNVNLAAEKMYGYPREYFVGRTPEFLSAPGKNNLAEITEYVRQAFNGQRETFEFLGLRKDGTIFPKDVSLTPGTYFGKKVVIAVARDITERKRAEEALSQSENLFRSVWENSRDGMRLAHANGQMVMVNQAFCDFVGKSREELKGKPLTDVYVQSDRERILNSYLENCSENKLDPYLERKFILWNREEIWFAVTNSFLNSNGAPPLVLSIFRDITERKRTEEALKISEEQYRQFFEDDLTGDYISTPDGKIISCNPAFVKIFGFASIEEALNTDGHALYTDWEKREEFLRLLKEKRKLEYYESEYLRRDGSRVYCIENAIGIFDAQGNLIQFRGYIFDDTKRKTLERQLVQAQKLESLGTLASGIAHDFNNILGIILGYATLLTTGEPNPENIRNSAQAVVKASMRGAALVKQLLTFARKADVLLAPVRVNDIVIEISKLLSETMAKTIVITLDLEKGMPAISADPTQVHQVLLNLCVNARDAMPNGGTLTIATHLQQGDAIRNKFPKAASRQYVVLSVADTGVGMDERTRNRIFEPFFTTKEIGKGTGLGLSVVFGIMESHKGFVNVESEPGKGTTFYLYFPIPESVEIDQAKTETQKEIPGGTETLLVIEDEELLRVLLRTALRSAGYTVLTAVDGQEAIDLFGQHQGDIQLVLSDIGLPKLSGYDVFRKMKRTKPNLRFILASGSIEPQMKSEFSKEGVTDFVQKPYSVYEVLQAVRTILDRK